MWTDSVCDLFCWITFLELEIKDNILNFNFAVCIHFCWHVDTTLIPYLQVYYQQHALPRPKPAVKN